MSEKLRFELTDDGHRYVALLDDKEVGFAEVDPISTDGLRIRHTEVSPEHEGRGIGGRLIMHMLEDARRQGQGVIPVCPYVATFIKRQPDLMEYVQESYRAVLGG